MSTYGDRGNIIVLQKRLAWRGVSVTIQPVEPDTPATVMNELDIVMMGGAQDAQQEVVAQDLLDRKGELLVSKLSSGMPGLFICGAYQFLGQFYQAADGTKIPGLGFFDMYTKAALDKPRLIGPIAATALHEGMDSKALVGFENHGGRTYFSSDKATAFARVSQGYGNNGTDHKEGMLKQSAIGTYMHGPLLPKNPAIADWLILQSLRWRHGYGSTLTALPTLLEPQARKAALKDR